VQSINIKQKNIYPVFLTAITVFQKPNIIPVCFSIDFTGKICIDIIGKGAGNFNFGLALKWRQVASVQNHRIK
jgi:hypothetical protein